MIADIIKNEILNPDVTERDIRSKAPGYQGISQKIPSQNTGYAIIGPDGQGYMQIRVDNEKQAAMVDRALGHIVDNKESAFFPRDPIAIARETQDALRRSPYDVVREPITIANVLSDVEGGLYKCVVPIDLDVIMNSDRETIMKILGNIAFGETVPVVSYEVWGYSYNELHLLVGFSFEEIEFVPEMDYTDVIFQ
jgi:hypothetical protein